MMLQNLDPRDELHLRVTGAYERRETALVKRILKPGQTFVDCGAHIGYFTVIAAEHVGPTGRVYAFEPNPDNIPVLRENVKDMPWVQVFEAAISDYDGKGRLYLSPTGRSVDARLIEMEGRESVEVDVVTLDTALAGARVDFLKMDIQGGEYRGLLGAAQTLARSPQMRGIVEFVNSTMKAAEVDPDALLDLLHASGFDIFTLRRGLKEVGPARRGLKHGLYKNLYIKKRGAA